MDNNADDILTCCWSLEIEDNNDEQTFNIYMSDESAEARSLDGKDYNADDADGDDADQTPLVYMLEVEDNDVTDDEDRDKAPADIQCLYVERVCWERPFLVPINYEIASLTFSCIDVIVIQSFCCDTVTSLCNMNENSKGDDEDGDNAPPDMFIC